MLRKTEICGILVWIYILTYVNSATTAATTTSSKQPATISKQLMLLTSGSGGYFNETWQLYSYNDPHGNKSDAALDVLIFGGDFKSAINQSWGEAEWVLIDFLNPIGDILASIQFYVPGHNITAQTTWMSLSFGQVLPLQITWSTAGVLDRTPNKEVVVLNETTSTNSIWMGILHTTAGSSPEFIVATNISEPFITDPLDSLPDVQNTTLLTVSHSGFATEFTIDVTTQNTWFDDYMYITGIKVTGENSTGDAVKYHIEHKYNDYDTYQIHSTSINSSAWIGLTGITYALDPLLLRNLKVVFKQSTTNILVDMIGPTGTPSNPGYVMAEYVLVTGVFTPVTTTTSSTSTATSSSSPTTSNTTVTSSSTPATTTTNSTSNVTTSSSATTATPNTTISTTSSSAGTTTTNSTSIVTTTSSATITPNTTVSALTTTTVVGTSPTSTISNVTTSSSATTTATPNTTISTTSSVPGTTPISGTSSASPATSPPSTNSPTSAAPTTATATALSSPASTTAVTTTVSSSTVVYSNYSILVNGVLYCPCSMLVTQNTTNSTVDIDAIIAELTLDEDKLSSNTRKYTSADDSRPSARTLGALGVIIITVVVASIVAMDSATLVSEAKKIKKNYRYLKKQLSKRSLKIDDISTINKADPKSEDLPEVIT